MSSLDIKISIRRITEYSESLQRTLGKKTLLLLIESFSKYVMNLYGLLIEEAINSSRYKGNWEPVDEEGYSEYLGVKPTGKILLYIRDALEVRKLGVNFVIRINPGYDYPGSRLPLTRVIKAIEYGTSKFNARPIVRRVVRDINSHILDLWRGYLSMKNIK